MKSNSVLRIDVTCINETYINVVIQHTYLNIVCKSLYLKSRMIATCKTDIENIGWSPFPEHVDPIKKS